MKKLISAFVMMFLCSISQAENMKFITVLSSPVGTFNKLEAVDPSSSAYGKTVNFCTKIGTQGLVKLRGTHPASLSTVTLSTGTTLGKTDEGKYSLSNVTLQKGGNITGGRLFGNTVTVNSAASGKARQLHGNTLTVAGAKTKTLDVNTGASKITAQHDGAEMVWSNEYQEDDACKEDAACAKQYLLKEKVLRNTSQKYQCIIEYQLREASKDGNSVLSKGDFFASCGYTIPSGRWDTYSAWPIGFRGYCGLGSNIKRFSTLETIPFLPTTGAVINEWYVYRPLYTCLCDFVINQPNTWGIGYFCVKWGEVEDKSLCKTPPHLQQRECPGSTTVY